MPKKSLLVSADKGEGQRLDVFLAPKLSDLSRSRIKSLIENENVLIDGKIRKSSYRLKKGESIRVEYSFEASEGIVPEDIPLSILYRDEDILVLNKPAGLVIHTGAGHKRHTLVHALLFHFPEIASVGPQERPGIVHRLDKETSGVLVVALRPSVFSHLQQQFKVREVEKTYLGLVKGRILHPKGQIEWPIGRHPKHGERISIRSDKPRDALTFYSVRQLYREATFLEIKPVTGRMHQIRVHLSAAGHPLLGDSRYGSRKADPKCPRLFLHATRLSFHHPRSQDRMTFESPLPPDLQAYLDTLT
ncbi:MAG: RluA family pseudouridine synthase [Candidatus Aminicenantes bacterium]|nr:RluA family pseudouridine synthase [Candidatus Aminicenantes bacterium]